MKLVGRSVKAKLGLGFAFTLALVALLSAVAIAAVQIMAGDTAQLYHKNLQGIAALDQASRQLGSLHDDIKGRLSAAREADLVALTHEIPKLRAGMDQAWHRYYPASIDTASEQKLARTGQSQWRALRAALKKMTALAHDKRFYDASDFYNDKLKNELNTLSGTVDHLRGMQSQSARAVYQHTARSQVRLQRAIIGTAATALVIVLLTAVLLTRMITRPLNKARAFVESVTLGRLNNEIEHRSKDEFGAVIAGLAEMQSHLAGMVSRVHHSADSVSVGAGQIASGNDELSNRTQEQAASLEETAASMEEMTATVKQNADNAAEADQLAQGVRQQAQEGGEIVGGAVISMDEINAASRKIADIVSLIDDIAFQTNLLALNASVEAARAGEQGRGFAVVATEVRQLATRSAEAAKDIKSLVKDSSAKVEKGSRQIKRSGESLDAIVAAVNKVSDIVAEIAAASKEQTGGIEQVNLAVSQMDGMTQHNASLVEQSAAASRSLEEQAEELKRQVAFFRLDHAAETETDAAGQPRQAASRSAASGASGKTAPETGYGATFIASL